MRWNGAIQQVYILGAPPAGRPADQAAAIYVVEPHANRVNAIGRTLVAAEGEIGGGIAKFPPALVAMFDNALDRVGPGEQAGRGARIASGEADRLRSLFDLWLEGIEKS